MSEPMDSDHDRTPHCDFCGKPMEPDLGRKRFCSEECKEDAGGPDWPNQPCTCLRCGQTFTPARWGQKYCKDDCRTNSGLQHLWQREELLCVGCGTRFRRGTHNQKFCSRECSERAQADAIAQKRTEWLPVLSICRVCSRSFMPNTRNQEYCSSTCRMAVKIKGRPAPIFAEKMHEGVVGTAGPGGNSVMSAELPTDAYGHPAFCFRSEREFHIWFNVSFPIFGIRRLRRSDGRFPDVSCETMTGEILHIELEFVSPRFRDHQGQLGSVNAVLCAVRRPQDRVLYGVPVFGLTVADFCGDDFDRKTQRLSPEAEQMFRGNLRFFVDDED